MTKKQKSELRRNELIEQLHNAFNKKLKETKDFTISTQFMENYLQTMYLQKPQEKSFYLSCALEFQRQVLYKIDQFRQLNKEKK